jgi:uncharacterized RmlC-like cupin family protein
MHQLIRPAKRCTMSAGTAPPGSKLCGSQENSMQHPSIRVVRPEQFNSATAQTPGSQRLAAVYSEAAMGSPMWGGLFLVDPGARTGIHHHGKQDTIAYVLSGSSYVRWGGARGVRCHRARGRFPLCPGMASAPGDQSFERYPVPVGRGAQYSRTHSCQSARRLLGITTA